MLCSCVNKTEKVIDKVCMKWLFSTTHKKCALHISVSVAGTEEAALVGLVCGCFMFLVKGRSKVALGLNERVICLITGL